MRIHHLSCATFCPPLATLVLPHGHLCTHVLAIESDEGLVLVDTGIGSADVAEPRRRLGWELLLSSGAHARSTRAGGWRSSSGSASSPTT